MSVSVKVSKSDEHQRQRGLGCERITGLCHMLQRDIVSKTLNSVMDDDLKKIL